MKHHTKIKICGLQSVEVVKSVAALDVDLCGYILAPSKRRITLEELDAFLPYSAEKSVAVMVNPSLQEVADLLNRSHVGFLQLHGQESAEFCREVKEHFRTPLLKAIQVRPERDPQPQIKNYAEVVDAFLFDTYHPRMAGGSGTSFAWETIPLLQQAAGGKPYWIAGGLTPDNVGQLIRRYLPYGVDVSSGVESADGIKDMQLVEHFVKAVREIEAAIV